MGRKLFLVFAAMFLVGMQFGCKDKQITAVNEQEPRKEAVASLLFDPSRISSKIPGGYVDIVEPMKAASNAQIHIGGWVADLQRKEPAKGVVIIADGKQMSVSPQTGLKREDVAMALKDDTLINSGWDLVFKASSLGKGRHTLEFYALLGDGTFAPLTYQKKPYCEIEVE